MWILSRIHILIFLGKSFKETLINSSVLKELTGRKNRNLVRLHNEPEGNFRADER